MELLNSFFRWNAHSRNKECSPTGYNDIQECIKLAVCVIILKAALFSVSVMNEYAYIRLPSISTHLGK